MKHFYLIFLFLFTLTAFPTFCQEKDTPRNGEGVHSFLRRNNRSGDQYYKEFLRLNKGKFGKNNALLLDVYYYLPPQRVDVTVPQVEATAIDSSIAESDKEELDEIVIIEERDDIRKKKSTFREPLFGKKYEYYTIKDNVLSGACFFLVSGHGGPDCGAIAKVDGRELHEDEYAYDIVLRLARALLEHGATVHIIIQDKKDGIRDGKYLSNSKTETCMGQKIPLDQVLRLKQRSDKINNLSSKAKEKYQRAIFVHLDSRSKKKQLDVFFYYQDGRNQSRKLANTMRKTFENHYNKHQPSRGFSGTVSTRDLYVLRNTKPMSIFVELANMQNQFDQRRYLLDDNRQALANWLCRGFIEDYKESKKK